MQRKYRLVQEEGKPPRVEKVGDDLVLSSRYVARSDGDGVGTPPCSNQPWPPRPDHEKLSAWNPDVSAPVCTMGPREPHPIHDLKDRGLTEVDVPYTEVTDVIACQAITNKSIKFEGQLGEGGGQDKAPQRVKACANLGEAVFQLKVAIRGDIDRLRRFEPGVALSTWGRGAPEAGMVESWARQFGQFSFAQAEYYFAGEGAPGSRSDYDAWRDEWLWSMSWKARMRRISFQAAGEDCASSKEIPGGKMTPFQQAKEKLGSLFLH